MDQTDWMDEHKALLRKMGQAIRLKRLASNMENVFRNIAIRADKKINELSKEIQSHTNDNPFYQDAKKDTHCDPDITHTMDEINKLSDEIDLLDIDKRGNQS